MTDEIKVGMADMKVGRGDDKLITYGLGSCVGLVIYDEDSRIAGLAHIMLPERTSNPSTGSKVAKFADRAVRELIARLIEGGAFRARLKAKIVGGAEMFSFANTDLKASIGSRNIEAVKKHLKNEGIRVVGEDTGSNYGRTLELEAGTGKVTVRTIGSGVIEI